MLGSPHADSAINRGCKHAALCGMIRHTRHLPVEQATLKSKKIEMTPDEKS